MLTNKYKAGCKTEYDTLRKVILCEPTYMNIDSEINETQRRYSDKGFNVKLAIDQHRSFVNKLNEQGVEVILLSAKQLFPEQVFTRDIGFTLGQTVYVAEMATDVRRGEDEVLKQWLAEQHVQFQNLQHYRIEGGDVIIDGSTIYIGQSDRTEHKAIKYIQDLLPHYEVISVPFTDTYLHLDCVFNVLSPTEALLYPGEIDEEIEKHLYSRYNIIEVTKEEQFTLGTNVLSIGDKKVFSQPINKNVNKHLRDCGYDVIEVDISEIIKSGGAFRCCTMPLLRG
ncbi:dimethylarginine dimethylaminohydrolase family protein [Cytobacillus horneckiae]|uniref:dimethylarginine dimethylaminohydrolase family protein n=1 Tax=Cytobacillus horneckiae TaxID=549687 RepID=UPI000ABB5B97|nr:arginine deiminase family protein [Cytobacillus horneckiae]MCM3179445.1 arginine deiminase family protein [Cytobacillus horneckiae]MEC1154871.1 arginine deiminase family protein [Cytobacillus horneckiae]MED2936223.1 arginine deiminase family protein [Cytobacillus horneckiae]